MTAGAFDIAFSPLLSWPVTLVLGALAVLAALVILALRARGAGWRCLVLAALTVALFNPTLVAEKRTPRPDVAVIVVDESASQDIGERRARTEAALAQLKDRLGRFSDLKLRVVRAGTGNAGTGGAGTESAGTEGDGTEAEDRTPGDGTYLFAALRRAVADLPRGRIAGAVLITDGQVHDVPKAGARPPIDAPIHVLLTGRRGEHDRRLKVVQAPRFGLVGQRAEMTVQVEDGADPNGIAKLTIRAEQGPAQTVAVRIGKPERISLDLDHRGENVFELEVAAGREELTKKNNRAVVVVNGVRDRLRVLLVSGEPYSGERVWRNLLKSDPSVDLVHFTILRPPEKQDGTPVRELSLISFPIRELFEVKLNDFDLVIFDHYRRRGLLSRVYLENIVRYIRGGGAVLEVAGPYFPTALSLYRTPLGDVLPGEPTGKLFERGFRPTVTKIGQRHPVTADLAPTGPTARPWGRWFRQIAVKAQRGNVVMAGLNGQPLLILDRVGKGRVAQLLSDQIWLWARGFEGGGPQAELLRRLAHWLMKEPELEEEGLATTVRGNRMEITRHSLAPVTAPVTVTAPSGAVTQVPLTEEGGGRAGARITVEEAGLYRLSDGTRKAVAAVGTLHPIEIADVRTTAKLLAPVAARTGGAVVWLTEAAVPEPRQVRPGRTTFGGRRGEASWIGFLDHRSFTVTGAREVPLLPAALVLLLALGGLVLAWWREGR